MTDRHKQLLGGATIALVALVLLWPMLGIGSGSVVRVVIPSGAGLSEVTDSLDAAGVIRNPSGFSLYARIRRADRKLKAGTYDLETRISWWSALRTVTRGEVVTVPVTVPEGFRLDQIAERLAPIAGVPVEEAVEVLRDDDLAARLGVPGPTLEGYLFPETYRFARGVPVSFMAEAMVARYEGIWTEERRRRLEASGLDEVELVTLASIIQAEARHVDEMPRISGVYTNRLDQGWLLQADPTVLYALGGYRARLLFAAIDSVADNPYNTYRQRGLPPGPIGAPGALAIDAALSPEAHDFMYFVAMPDGSHVFTRSLREHNAAREDAARARNGDHDGS